VKKRTLIISGTSLTLLVALISFATWAIYAIIQPVSVKNHPASLEQDISIEILKSHVKTLSVDYAPRSYRHMPNLERTAFYIKTQLKLANATVREHQYNASGLGVHNIVAEFGPDTKERIVIGAHYDAYGSTPGADDNASGIAVLIELAKLLAKAKLETKVELVAFTLEEPPFFQTNLMGSYQQAQHSKSKGHKIKLMISLEMLGYFSDEENSQNYPIGGMSWIYPTKGNFIALVGSFEQREAMRDFKTSLIKFSSVPVESISAPGFVHGVDFSDHQSYWKHNYNAIMITDTAFFRNPHYHEATDTFEKLNYKKMREITKALYFAILDYAKQEKTAQKNQ
jgi:hypothetical protein